LHHCGAGAAILILISLAFFSAKLRRFSVASWALNSRLFLSLYLGSWLLVPHPGGINVVAQIHPRLDKVHILQIVLAQ